MGIPLLFTQSGTLDKVVVPFPGLYPSDELYPGEAVYPDDGPTLDFYATPPDVVAFGVTVEVAPEPVTFSGGDVVLGGVDQVVVAVDPEPVIFDATPPGLAGADLVVVSVPEPVTFGATVPGTSGGQLLILIPSVRELPPLRLSHLVETPSGRKFRWGPDERLPENVPSGERFSDTMPGGFETGDCTLPRKTDTDYSDLERLSVWTMFGAGGEIAWQGRLERAPRVSGDQMSVSPSAVGWIAHLEDDKSAAEVYVDAELSNWGNPTATRVDTLNGSNFKVEYASAVGDVGNTHEPALRLAVSDLPTSGWKRVCQATYVFPGTSSGFGFVHFWSLMSQFGGAWNHSFFTDTDGNLGAPVQQSGNYASADTIGYWGPTTRGNNYVSTQWLYNAFPSIDDGAEYTNHLRRLRVYGNHGLTVHEPEPGVTGGGFLASDVIAHAVGKWAPLLNMSTGPTGTVRPSGFVIPHLVFRDLTTAGEMVRQTTRFGLQDWGVWDDKTFWWHDRGAVGRRWRARIGPAQLEETGPQADRLWESVIVQYQDVDGTTRTVGPPGSGANIEDAGLKDTDPDNPANRSGIVRRALLTMGTSLPAPAIQIGTRFLYEQKLLDRSGRARLVGVVEDDRGVVHPYWKVRAGDLITFVDSNDTSYRRIVKTDKDHASRTCSVDLDAPPGGLQELLERFGVGLTDLGLS